VAAANAAGNGSSNVAAVRLYDLTEQVEDREVTVPVVAVATEVPAAGIDTAAAASDAIPAAITTPVPADGAAEDGVGAGVSVADEIVGEQLPAAVVVATAVAASDDATVLEQQTGDGWEPRQLAVATTVITAAPIADVAGEQGDAAAAAAGVGDAETQNVVVTTVTDVLVTMAPDAAEAAGVEKQEAAAAGATADMDAAVAVQQVTAATADNASPFDATAEPAAADVAAAAAPSTLAASTSCDVPAAEAVAVEQQDVSDEEVAPAVQQQMSYAQALLTPSSPLPAAPAAPADAPAPVPAAMLAMLPPIAQGEAAAPGTPAAASVDSLPVTAVQAPAEVTPETPPPPAAAAAAAGAAASPRSGSALAKLQQELQHLKQHVATNVAVHSIMHSPVAQSAMPPAAVLSSVLAAPNAAAAIPAIPLTPVSIEMPAAAVAEGIIADAVLLSRGNAAADAAAEEGGAALGFVASSNAADSSTGGAAVHDTAAGDKGELTVALADINYGSSSATAKTKF
jgi:hypothetical protein